VITWLHQYERERDEQGRIVATERDFHEALALVSESLRRAWASLTPAEETVLAAVKKLSDKFQREGFKRRNLMVPGYSDRAIKLALNSLASTGYLDCDERRGPQGYSYSLVERPEITGLGIELCPLPDSEKSPANSKEIAGKPGDAQYCPMPDNEGKVVYAGKSGPGYDVYIGNRLARTGHARSFFHNPVYKERDPVERFEEYLDGMLQNSEEWRRELEALRGKTL